MKRLTYAVLAAGCLLAAGSVCYAQDTIRLGGPSAQIDMQGGTDTELVRGYYGGRGWGGHGHGGWGHGGWGRGYYAGGWGRGWYGGYGRGWYGGYGRGWYGGYGGYYPYYAGYYQPSYYTPYYYSSYYYPCVGEIAPTVALQGTYSQTPNYGTYSQTPNYGTYSQTPKYAPNSELLPLPGGNSTFPYDGGPQNPIPLPAPQPIPGQKVIEPNRGILPLDGKLVSLPAETTGGFTPVTAPSRTTTTPATVTPRVNYPAYGDEPIVPAPRRTR